MAYHQSDIAKLEKQIFIKKGESAMITKENLEKLLTVLKFTNGLVSTLMPSISA